ncbi:hypothetical protein BS50DRAFT_616185 [Corynespora cassiicola Philippines]|uniref:Uncharacterized protein n=1 Tax=Corynespora cassiicola Philippines TaxID=1448308 RepID=A0A2T2PD51_CORCC|nr:hypothetical protein BS50DRAFT_616185 [Corynespora cassiicola Philippines]
MARSCTCVLDTLSALLRVEQVRQQRAAMDMLLELAELCETRCMTMLACSLCRAQRFPLLCATAISARTVDLFKTSWSARDQHAVAISIGGDTLDWTDTGPLLDELVSLQVENMSSMQRSLESVFTRLEHADRTPCLDTIRSNLNELQHLRERLTTGPSL